MSAKSNTDRSVSLLIVEDDMTTLDILKELINFKYPNIVVNSAKNGKKGLELFQEYLPDLVITDIYMPELDGYQMTDKIREIKPGVKIIVFSAAKDNYKPENTKGKAIEIDHHLQKPVNFRGLLNAIDLCLAENVHHETNSFT
jgi:YesN/AraC family two-component response regulator